MAPRSRHRRQRPHRTHQGPPRLVQPDRARRLHRPRAARGRRPPAHGLDAEEVEDVIVGCRHARGLPGHEHRAASPRWPPASRRSVAATTVNRFCSSGSQAVMMAAHQIVHEEGADVAIGAGVETITMMQDGTQNTNRMVNANAKERFPGLYFPMGVTAEIVAERYDVIPRGPGRVLAAEPAALRRRGRREGQDRRGHRRR